MSLREMISLTLQCREFLMVGDERSPVLRIGAVATEDPVTGAARKRIAVERISLLNKENGRRQFHEDRRVVLRHRRFGAFVFRNPRRDSHRAVVLIARRICRTVPLRRGDVTNRALNGRFGPSRRSMFSRSSRLGHEAWRLARPRAARAGRRAARMTTGFGYFRANADVAKQRQWVTNGGSRPILPNYWADCLLIEQRLHAVCVAKRD